MMLRGRFEHTLDDKGRISIPARFRDVLAKSSHATLIVTNLDRCLVAYPLDEWQNLERKVAALPQMKPEVKAFQRFFISGASECTLDKQGRILLPPNLRDFAAIEKEAMIVGLLKKFEIWSVDRWQQEFESARNRFASLSDLLGDLGI